VRAAATYPAFPAATPDAAPEAAPDAAVRGTPWWIGALWLLAAILTLMLLVAAGVTVTAVGVLVATPLYLLGLALVGRLVREDRHFCLHLYTGAFLARYCAALFILFVMTLAGVTALDGGADYVTYDAQGWYLAENWRAGIVTFAVTDKDPGYFFVVAAVYAIIGHFALGPTMLNVFFGALAAVVVVSVGRELFDRRTALIAGMLSAFVPTLLFWGSFLYKDTILAFLMALGWLLAIRLARQRTPRAGLYLMLVFLPLFLMRPESAMTLGIAAFVLNLWAGRIRFGRVVGLGLALAGVFGLLIALESFGMAGKIAVVERFANPITEVVEHREMWADAVAQERAQGFSRALYGRNLLLEPHLLLLATALPFLSPLPGSAPWGLNFYTFLFPAHLLWLALLPAIGYGALWTLRNRTPERVVLLALLSATAVGVALAGYFSNPRYLIQVVPLFLLFAAVGIRDFRRWRLFYGMGACAAVMMLAAYGLAKGL
jgi:4-amino-4-deoxy-L-arabinose transferase-like glycosyltransferase